MCTSTALKPARVNAAAPNVMPLAQLPTRFHKPARAKMRAWRAYHGRLGFTGDVVVKCSYYLGTPRLLVFAVLPVDGVVLDGWMLFEIYIGDASPLNTARMPYFEFEALWNASNPPMSLR